MGPCLTSYASESLDALRTTFTRHSSAPASCSTLQRQRRWRRREAAAARSCAPQLQRLATCAASADEGMLSSQEAEPPLLSDDDPLTSEDEQLGTSGRTAAAAAAPRQNGGGGGGMGRDRWRVPLPPHLHGKAPRKHWNANALAFLGDSVWELYARRRFFYPPSAKDSYFASVVHHVRAETQEKLYVQLMGSGFLTDAERDVLRWGRNATGVTPKRLNTGLKRETYRSATAMECLCGYLYLSDPDRLHGMMGLLGLGDAPEPQEAAAPAASAGRAADGGGSGSSNGSGRA